MSAKAAFWKYVTPEARIYIWNATCTTVTPATVLRLCRNSVIVLLDDGEIWQTAPRGDCRPGAGRARPATPHAGLTRSSRPLPLSLRQGFIQPPSQLLMLLAQRPEDLTRLNVAQRQPSQTFAQAFLSCSYNDA